MARDELLANAAPGREVTRKLARFAGRAEQAIFVGNRDGCLEWANDAASRLCGLAPEELRGRRLELFPDDAEAQRAAAAHIGARLDAGEPARVEASLRDCRGRVLWVELEVVPIAADEGNAGGWVAVARDATERKRAEDALAETEERYRSLAELSPEAVAVHSEGCLVYANPAALELLGAASGDEVLGRPVFDFVHPDFRGLVAERILKMQVVGDPAAPLTESLLRVDGSPVEVELAAAPIVWRGRPAIQLTGHPVAAPARDALAVDLARLVLELSARIEQRIAPRAAVSFDLAAAPVAAAGDAAHLVELVSTLVAQAAATLPGGRGSLCVRTRTRELGPRELARCRPSKGVRAGRFAMLEVAARGGTADAAPHPRLFDPAFPKRCPRQGPGLAGALATARSHRGALRVAAEPAGSLRIEACLPAAAPRERRPRS